MNNWKGWITGILEAQRVHDKEKPFLLKWFGSALKTIPSGFYVSYNAFPNILWKGFNIILATLLLVFIHLKYPFSIEIEIFDWMPNEFAENK